VASPVSGIIGELLPTMRRGDFLGYQELFNRLYYEGRALSPGQLTEAIAELAPVLAVHPGGVFARLALVAGAYAEWGGSAQALAATTPAVALEALRWRARFSELWPNVSDGRAEPSRDQAPSMDEVGDAFHAAAGRLGLSKADAEVIALSWFDTPHSEPGRDGRLARPRRARPRNRPLRAAGVGTLEPRAGARQRVTSLGAAQALRYA